MGATSGSAIEATTVQAVDPLFTPAPSAAGFLFAPALSAAGVVDATRGREVASEPDKDLFFFAP